MVEDHYQAGGIGEAVMHELCNTEIKVTSLFVDKLPRSGTTEELLSYEEIDVKSIVTQVKKTT